MTKIELKDIVKKYFNLAEKNETLMNTEVKSNFTEATLADGTKISNMVDADFEVGQELHVHTEAGEMVVAPSGEHTTESGIVITVDGEGKITGVKHPDAEGQGSLEASPVSEEMAEVDPGVVTSEDVATGDESVGFEDEDIREAIISAIAEVVAPELEMLKAKMSEMEEQMKKHYSAEPAAKPSLESKFSKTENKPLGFLNQKFDAKKAQFDSILSRNKKK